MHNKCEVHHVARRARTEARSVSANARDISFWDIARDMRRRTLSRTRYVDVYQRFLNVLKAHACQRPRNYEERILFKDSLRI